MPAAPVAPIGVAGAALVLRAIPGDVTLIERLSEKLCRQHQTGSLVRTQAARRNANYTVRATVHQPKNRFKRQKCCRGNSNSRTMPEHNYLIKGP